ITSTLQNADPRRRVVSGQTVPIAHHNGFEELQQQQQHGMLGRMSHDGVTMPMHTADPHTQSEYMHQPGYNNSSNSEQNVPMWHHDSLLMPATQLHPITEHPEPSVSSNEQPQQQTGKVRRNLFNGFRRAVKAVKTAAVATSRSEVFRKESISQMYQPPVIMSSRTDQPQLQPQTPPQFALYPGVRSSPTSIAPGNWTNSHSESIAYSPRRTTMPAVATTNDHVSRVLPISQPGPRQRSLTQQAPVSPIARLYSENAGPARSIDIQRNADTHEPAVSPVVLGSGLPYSRPPESPSRVGPLTNALSPSRFRQRRSPDTSHSSINSSASTGSMHAYHLGATNRSYDLSQSRRQSATPHTARSADAIPRLTSPVTPPATLAKPADIAPIFDVYPKRDRSMTLPSEQSNTYRQTSAGYSLAPPPPLPPRSAPRLRSYSGMPPRTASTQVPLPMSLGLEKIELSISGSPLFKPTTDEDRVHSAGEFIHEQAVQNMSLADLSRDPSSNSSDHLMMQLPPPAVALSESPAEKGEVMVDAPQYVSMMINSDKLKNYLKQVSDGEQAAEYQSMIQTMEAHEKAKNGGQNRQSVFLDPPTEKSDICTTNNDSGVQVDDNQLTGLGGMVPASQEPFSISDNIESEHTSMERTDDSKHMETIRGSESSTSLSDSRLSLPLVSNSSSNGGMAEPASIVGSPPSPFSFSHSRFSLINQDGSLNLASIQFDQLDGYQKRLSGSMGSLSTTTNAHSSLLPQRSESKITDRLTRRVNNGGESGGWFRSTLALSSSENHRDRSTSPPPLVPTRSPRLPFASSVGDRLETYITDNNVGRQSKLMRKVRKPSSFALSTGSAGSGELPAIMGTGGVPLGVFNFSMSTDGQQARQQARMSESSYSGGERSNSSRRPSQTLYPSFAVHPVNRRPSDNTSIASQNSLYRPNNSSRTHLFADKPAQRLMYLGDISPFDMVYRSSVGSMSLEQALTLVEGTTDPTSTQQQTRMSRHRRLHKRSASALNPNELDDIMIQTAEMCHSIQTAIKMQRASESGLGKWIQAAFGEPQKPQEEHNGSNSVEDSGLQPIAEAEQQHLSATVNDPPIADDESHSLGTMGDPPLNEIEHQSLETVEEAHDALPSADDPEPVHDLHSQPSFAPTTGNISEHSDHGSKDNGYASSSPTSSESSLEIWPSRQTHHQHLGGDTKSTTSSDESIDVSDPIQTTVPPSPRK
ncbi:hypothetical protein GGI05_001272, partial [Coemansia sp. RSA 2603]